MKRLLALCLSMLLLVSILPMAVAADDAPSRVIITSCDDLSGWSGEVANGIPDPEIAKDIDPSGYGVVTYTYTGHLYASGGWRHPDGNGKTPTNGIKIIYNASKTDTKSYDITGMDVLAFEFYVSDVSLVNSAAFQMEIGSAAKADAQENNLESSLNGMMCTTLKNGWNHVEIPLTMFSQASGDDKLPMNYQGWNFLRLYNMSEIDLGDKELLLGFDNLHFAKSSQVVEADPLANEKEMTATEHRVPVFGCNSALGKLIPDPAEKTAGNASISYTFDKMETATNRSALGYTVDGTGMDTLELDVYLSDLEIVSMFTSGTYIADNGIELGSAGRPDYGEYAWRLPAMFSMRDDWKVGWNHVSLPLSMATETLSGKPDAEDGVAFDISAINFLGIYWVMKADAPKQMTIKFDNIVLTDAQVNAEAKAEGEATPVLALAEQLKDVKLATITPDNYETIQAQYAELEKAYDLLSMEGKNYADERMNISSIIRVVGRALENYAATLEPETPPAEDEPVVVPPADDDDEPVVTPPAEDPTTPPTEEPTTPPAEEDPTTPPTDDEPTEPAGNNSVVIIAVIAVVVVAAVVVGIVVAKKKKK